MWASRGSNQISECPYTEGQRWEWDWAQAGLKQKHWFELITHWKGELNKNNSVLYMTTFLCKKNLARKFPVILPHLLVPWLIRNGLFPDVAATELRSHWQHMKSRGADHANLVDDEMEHKFHPFYLWADDAVYNQLHEKLMVIVLGHCLDPKKNSVETCWPLCCIRVDSWIQLCSKSFFHFTGSPNI